MPPGLYLKFFTCRTLDSAMISPLPPSPACRQFPNVPLSAQDKRRLC